MLFNSNFICLYVKIVYSLFITKLDYNTHDYMYFLFLFLILAIFEVWYIVKLYIFLCYQL